MNMPTRELFLAVAICALPNSANAAPLSVVKVVAPEINCVFETDCTVTVTDTVGDIKHPGATGVGKLQTRTFKGQKGAPAAKMTAYEYRLDMSGATALGDSACITALAVEFGPVVLLQYNKTGPTDAVFVVTKGGTGTIGLLSADQNGNVITFTFSQPVCAADAIGPGNSSFFFGLTSKGEPKVTPQAWTYRGLVCARWVHARHCHSRTRARGRQRLLSSGGPGKSSEVWPVSQ